jgi:hypothetical protein
MAGPRHLRAMWCGSVVVSFDREPQRLETERLLAQIPTSWNQIVVLSRFSGVIHIMAESDRRDAAWRRPTIRQGRVCFVARSMSTMPEFSHSRSCNVGVCCGKGWPGIVQSVRIGPPHPQAGSRRPGNAEDLLSTISPGRALPSWVSESEVDLGLQWNDSRPADQSTRWVHAFGAEKGGNKAG